MLNKELSQVKLDFNNDVIKLKKFLVQAKTRSINAMSKKVKKLKNDKLPEQLQAKNRRKVDALLEEIFLIKKVQVSELGKFAVQSLGQLRQLMDSPQPSAGKAMARLAAQACISTQLQALRDKYSVVPAEQLLQQDPRKVIKKKIRERKKLQKKKAEDKDKQKHADREGDGEEAQAKDNIKNQIKVKKLPGRENNTSDIEDEEPLPKQRKNYVQIKHDTDEESAVEDAGGSHSQGDDDDDDGASGEEILHSKPLLHKPPWRKHQTHSNDDDDDDEEPGEENSSRDKIVQKVKLKMKFQAKPSHYDSEDEEGGDSSNSEIFACKSEQSSKQKSLKYSTKDKNNDDDDRNVDSDSSGSNEMPLYAKHKEKTSGAATHGSAAPESRKTSKRERYPVRKINVDLEENQVAESDKTVDSFFMTESGGGYMTLALPRAPDYTAEAAADRQGRLPSNRRARRAAAFGKELLPRKRPSRQGVDGWEETHASYSKERLTSQRPESKNSRDNSLSGGRNNARFSKSHNDGPGSWSDSKSSSKFNKYENVNKKNAAERDEALHPSWAAKKHINSIVTFQGKKIAFD